MTDVNEALDTRPLGELLRRPPRYGINAAAVSLSSDVPTYIRITDIDEEGHFSPSPKVGVSHPNCSNYLLQDGEMVFARTGATVGKSYLYDRRDGELVYAGFLINIAPDPKRLNPKYLSLFAQTKQYWDWIARTSVRSGQPGVNGREYAQLPVPVPDIVAQDRIAAAMSNVDELIATLDRLITKRRAIKQGMMQELLTGQTRLPGFSEPWSEVRLGSVSHCLRGVAYDPHSDLSAADTSFTVRLLRSNNVQGANLDLRDLQFVHERRVKQQQMLACGDIVICMANGSRTLVGKSALFEAKQGSRLRYTVGAFMGALRISRASANPRYIAELLNGKRFRDWLDVILAGSSINNLKPSDVEGFVSAMPNRSEQDAIANVLRNVNEEMAALRASLEKVRDIKQAMMQGLLTGRTRFPVVGTVA